MQTCLLVDYKHLQKIQKSIKEDIKIIHEDNKLIYADQKSIVEICKSMKDQIIKIQKKLDYEYPRRGCGHDYAWS